MAGRAAGSRKKLDTQLTPSPFLGGMPQMYNGPASPGFPPSPPSSTQSYVPVRFGSPNDSQAHDVASPPPWMTPYPSSPQRSPRALSSWNETPETTTHFSLSALGNTDRESVSRALPPYHSPPHSGHSLIPPTVHSHQLNHPPTPNDSPLGSQTTLGRRFSPNSSTISSIPTIGDASPSHPWADLPYKHSPYHSPPSSPPSTSSNLTDRSFTLSSPSIAPNAPRSFVAAPSTYSGSSEEEQFHASGSRPVSFVYPSARTRARPSKAPGPGFQFGKLKAPMVTVEVLAPGTPIPAVGVFTASPSSGSAPSVISTSHRSTFTTSASASSTETGPAITAPTTFYFPSGRTRAHPRAPGLHFGKGKKEKETTASEERVKTASGFMRLSLKSKKAPTTSSSSSASIAPTEPIGLLLSRDGSPSQCSTPMSPSSPVYETFEEGDGRETGSSPLPAPPPQYAHKIGAYPLDPYDPALMEIDRQTWDLMRKLNRTHNGPSFHNYGDRPPATVLDLGCGAGYWVLDAAMAWRTAGTQVVGFDMMDTMRGMWATAQRQGIAGNIKFVRGNFLKDPLPFPDASFDLVRMANLSLCIPYSHWKFVLDQARRVLVVGGRLEFIDDHVFFPYGKPLTAEDIPVAGFGQMNLAGRGRRSSPVMDDGDSIIYNILTEGQDDDGTADPISSPASETASETWHEQVQSARELETLFENMLGFRYGIHPRPAEFVFELLLRVFGGVKEITAMHLTLAPREQSHLHNQKDDEEDEEDVLAQSPGLILWPSTFVPLSPAELEACVLKHQRVLLSCKAALVDYAADIGEEGEGDTAMEALWEYQNFLHERFNPPAEGLVATDDAAARGPYSETLHDLEEYQNELQTHYEWAYEPEPTSAPPPPASPRAPLPAHLVLPPIPTSPPPLPPPIQRARPPLPTIPTTSSSLQQPPSPSIQQPPSPSIRKTPRSPSSPVARRAGRASIVSTRTTAPPYSRVELPHVRTFYVYEAVKQSDGRFGLQLDFPVGGQGHGFPPFPVTLSR
ncbi:hypothetical protein C8F01DRAFT_1020819 [Mycena amicta]|nr:hypothetical protein C8F01DRAFT_1020819 [Mycena amicta]